jgi:hypothetical protein
MATPTDIARVREYIAEADDSNGWTDPRIGMYIDENTGLYAAAADIWGVKASAYAALVDVSESGSSRRMSSLHTNAKEREAYYRSRAGTQANEGAPFTVPIARR